MVYRGKPSAGCENCRKAKKRCTLEQPACTRCVKLRKECIGYRDTSQLQIQDETQSVLQKAERKRVTNQTLSTTNGTPSLAKRHKTEESPVWQITSFNDVPTTASKQQGIALPPLRQSPLTYSFVTPDGRHILDDSLRNTDQQLKAIPELKTMATYDHRASAYGVNLNLSNIRTLIQWASGIPRSPYQLPDDVAVDMFLNCCTAADGPWSYVHQGSFMHQTSMCLNLAIKACGLAALNNVRMIPSGRELSRSMYTKAIGLLNDALQDPERSRQDDSLIAVTMLGFYENLTCDSMQSIKSWKAHIQGATQLLRLRGKSQFNTMTGRQLYRELRAQVMVSCIWSEQKPPDFFREWQKELALKSTSLIFIGPTDLLMDIAYDFGELRYAMKMKDVSSAAAFDIANHIDARLAEWASATMLSDERWIYRDLYVGDGPNVWKGMVHSYICLPIPVIWNMYRAIRILVSRTHELLAREAAKTPEEEKEQIARFRNLRHRMTNDICATLPCLLGHAAPAFCSPCVLTTAYSSIWPIFFASTCALERIGMNMWEQEHANNDIASHAGTKASTFSDAAQQAAWLLGRLDYISGVIGVKWADGIAGSIREAIKVHKEKAMAYGASLPAGSPAQLEYITIAGEIVRGVMGWRQQLAGKT